MYARKRPVTSAFSPVTYSLPTILKQYKKGSVSKLDRLRKKTERTDKTIVKRKPKLSKR